jgi:hypothetical protein
MFIPEYLQRLIEIGEADAEARIDDIRRVVMGDVGRASARPVTG